MNERVELAERLAIAAVWRNNDAQKRLRPKPSRRAVRKRVVNVLGVRVYVDRLRTRESSLPPPHPRVRFRVRCSILPFRTVATSAESGSTNVIVH